MVAARKGTMSKKTNCIGKPEQKPHFKTPPVVSKAPVTRYFVDVAKDDSVFAQVVLAQRGFRCRDIHEENGQTVRITIEDQTLRAEDIQAIFAAAAANAK